MFQVMPVLENSGVMLVYSNYGTVWQFNSKLKVLSH